MAVCKLLYKFGFVFLLGMMLCQAQVNAVDQPGGCEEKAEVVLQKMSDNIMSKLEERSKTNKVDQAWLIDVIESELLPNIDQKKLAQMVLGKYWREADDAQRKLFYKAFYKLIARTYATVFTQSSTSKSSIKIYFLPVRDRSGKYQKVSGVIKLPTGALHEIVYYMICRNGSWLAYDISIDGVVMSQSYQAQFEPDLSKGGIDELLRNLEPK